MNTEVDFERLVLAEKAVRAELLAERAPGGYWPGRVGSSPIATAAAISALVISHRQDCEDLLREDATDEGAQVIQQLVQGDLSELLLESVHWLARRQNDDGGWGDCDGARSNLAATMLVQSAFRLTGVPAKYADLMMRADEFVASQGGLAGLRKHFAAEKTYLAAIMANAALADLIPWRQVPTIPFEWLFVSPAWRNLSTLGMRSLSPTAIAVGLAKFHHDPTPNPAMRLVRRGLRTKALSALEQLQASDEGFEASPLTTAFVVMNVAGMGFQEHPIVERGVEFLLSNVRADASWAVTTSFATRHTCQAIEALNVNRAGAETAPDWHGSAVSVDVPASDRGHAFSASSADEYDALASECVTWLLKTQHLTPDPRTNARAGGWGANDSPGAKSDAIATAAGLMTIANHYQSTADIQRRIERAAGLGIQWLLEMQNTDGGWPTYERGDKSQPGSASGVDPTAQSMRALIAWQQRWENDSPRDAGKVARQRQIAAALERGTAFLRSQQRENGSFVPLWSGNQHQTENKNPVLGTAQVLAVCEATDQLQSEMARRAAAWLMAAQHAEGGWGPPRAPVDYSDDREGGVHSWRDNDTLARFCTVEETSAAVAALLPLAAINPAVEPIVFRGLKWLTKAVEEDAHRRPAVLGVYWAGIWYYDRLAPAVSAAGALSRAVAAAEATRSATTPVG